MEILRTDELCRLLKISTSALHAWRRNDPGFPKPVRLGPRLLGWMEADIKEWLEKQKEKAA